MEIEKRESNCFQMIDPSEKAKELIEEFKPFVNSMRWSSLAERDDPPYECNDRRLDNAKKCASICCDQIMKAVAEYPPYKLYWKRVKDEVELIKKL